MKNLAFAVGAACVCGFCFADLYMAGDSTMCNYNPTRQYPQQGWGQGLANFMKNPDELHNWAIGGRSARSFTNEGRWAKIVEALKPGDFVIVAFGHNDANRGKTERYSTPEDFKGFLRDFARDVKSKDAQLVFATSIPHSGGFSQSEGKMHVRGGAAGIGPYVQATVEVAQELGLGVLDLNKYACEHLPELGLESANRLYMRIKPGEYERLPNGQNDGCHIRDTGAVYFARAAVELAYAQNLPIAKLFKRPEEVHYTPVPFGGPGSSAKPLKDDFSKEEIPYANAGAKIDNGDDWRRELMNLRREAQGRGMSKDEASRWAAQEYRRRHRK